MDIKKVYIAYFSATYSTKKIVREIASRLKAPVVECDITARVPAQPVALTPDDLLVIGVPAYGGRVPEEALGGIRSFTGHNTPVIPVCVYGNRAYDDTLAELRDLCAAQGFIPVGAAACVAQHSVFPAVATGRPDAADMHGIVTFCRDITDTLARLTHENILATKLELPGGAPYRRRGGAPIHPEARHRCNSCGTCAGLCPVQAIPSSAPSTTDASRCIACGRCIAVCPQKARSYTGLLYRFAAWKFRRDNHVRREPEFFLPQ